MSLESAGECLETVTVPVQTPSVITCPKAKHLLRAPPANAALLLCSGR